MSSNITINQPQPHPTNGLGVAGFVISLLGWVSCGLLCPIGLVFSTIGLRREPRGMAIAGFVLGLVGSIGWAIIFAVFGFVILAPCLTAVGMGGLMRQRVQTVNALAAADMMIESYVAAHRTLPIDIDGATAIAGATDGWGHPLKYHRITSNTFEIRSDGPDGLPGNGDDITQTQSITLPPATGPEAPR